MSTQAPCSLQAGIPFASSGSDLPSFIAALLVQSQVLFARPSSQLCKSSLCLAHACALPP